MANTKIKNTGLFEPGIYIGTVEETGIPPVLSAMSHIGDIVPDSLTREDDENTYTQLKSQETGDVWQELLSEEGTKKFVFSTWDFNTDNLLKAMGGAVDSEGSWTPPIDDFRGAFYAMAYVSRPDDEYGLHFVMNYPKVKLKGKMEGIQQEGDGNKLMFEATIYTPENATGVKQPYGKFDLVPKAPTNLVGDDTADEIAWDYVPGFPLATAYEISEDGGGESGTWADCTANPQSVTPPLSADDVVIRVKADTTSDTKHKAGFEAVYGGTFAV